MKLKQPDMRPFIKKLGFKLFHLAVDLSRQPIRSAKEMTEAIKGIKRRKKMRLSDALLLVAECRDAISANRQFRHPKLTPLPAHYPPGTVVSSLFLRRDTTGRPPIDIVTPLATRLVIYKGKKENALRETISDKLSFRKPSHASRYKETITFSTNHHDWRCDTALSPVRHGGYSYTAMHLHICVPPDWLESVLFEVVSYCGNDNDNAVDGEFHFLVGLRKIGTEINGGRVERQYEAVWGRQCRGLSVKTCRGFMIIAERTTNTHPFHVDRFWEFGYSLKEVQRGLDGLDPFIAQQIEEKRKAREQKLREAIALLELIQGGKKSIEDLSQSDRIAVMKAVQAQIAIRKRITENFGGLGKRAIGQLPVETEQRQFIA